MDTEKAHLEMGHDRFFEPKVHSLEAQHQIALAATKNIPGASDIVNNHFTRRPLNMPFALKPTAIFDQEFHHIVGEVYN